MVPPPLSSSPPRPDSFLPTTVMERYLARPSHGSGMVFSITLVLDGRIEIESLRQAWFETLHRHPRIYARLVGRNRHQKWELQPHALDASFVYRSLAADNEADIDDAESVRPRLSVGMKCVIQSSDQHQWSIRLLFHHACCDGVGAIRMIGQFVKTYTNVDRRLRPSEVLQVDTQLRRTEPSGYTPPQPIQIPDFQNLWTTIRGKNIRLSQHDIVGHNDCDSKTGTTIATFQNSHRLMFSRSQSDRIREALRSKKLTLNDWAVAVTLHTCASVTRSTASTGNYVMIMNPVEMRAWAQRHDTSNHIGIALVRRTLGQLDDIHQTLDSVSEQMQNVRRYGTANELAGGIAVAERIPGCLGLFERWGTFTPTASLTSVAGLRLGKRFGVHRQNESLWIAEAQLTDVFFEAPIQNGGEVSTTIWEFEGQIAVSHRTRSDVLDTDDNLNLLTRWASIALDACG